MELVRQPVFLLLFTTSGLFGVFLAVVPYFGFGDDPKMVKESLAAVEKAGLKDKIAVREGNALKLEKKDLEDINVVMLYMGDELNIRLRPALWEHLKPGSRVVSHRFIMGDWAPDKSITVNRDGDYGNEDFELHLWIVTGKEKTGEYKKAKK